MTQNRNWIAIPTFGSRFTNFSKSVSYEVNITSQHSHLEVLLLSKFWSERGISIDTDSGPLRYVLWCCGSICHQLFTFIQIGCDHIVIQQPSLYRLSKIERTNPAAFHSYFVLNDIGYQFWSSTSEVTLCKFQLVSWGQIPQEKGKFLQIERPWHTEGHG